MKANLPDSDVLVVASLCCRRFRNGKSSELSLLAHVGNKASGFIIANAPTHGNSVESANVLSVVALSKLEIDHERFLLVHKYIMSLNNSKHTINYLYSVHGNNNI